LRRGRKRERFDSVIIVCAAVAKLRVRLTSEPKWRESVKSTRRTDYHMLDDDLFIAADDYCVTPGCDCRDRCVAFRRTGDHDGEPVGRVRVPVLGDVKLESEPGCGRKLRGLWDLYQRRYPSYRERLDRRMALMQAWGSRYVPPLLEQKTERVARTPDRMNRARAVRGRSTRSAAGRRRWAQWGSDTLLRMLHEIA